MDNFDLLFKWTFLTPIVVVGLMGAVHAWGYLHGRKKLFYFLYFATALSMAGVVLAENALTFLLAWELMGLFSSGLVLFDAEDKATKRAGYIYLLACQAGGLALMLAFFSDTSGVSGALGDRPLPIYTALLVIGFGLKVGFPPFHVWLPEAHPAAPAPASALMSGAMIPLGLYGLINFGITNPYIYLILGAAGALFGILFALPQANLKKLLAFSSVENMGIISMAIGLGFLSNDPFVKKLAFGGAALHVINHAILKGGLFLSAGNVMRFTGHLNMDKMGGLIHKMPKTGAWFILSAWGLAGLPPLNGFFSEILIFWAAFASGQYWVAFVLALCGGLAVAAYTKSIGAVFLGTSRSDDSHVEVERGRSIWGCGYEKPNNHMQYTGTSFTRPLVEMFEGILKPRTHLKVRQGDAAIATETDDRILAGFWQPIFHFAARYFQVGHLLQNGSLHFYILLILITVFILLVCAVL